MKHIQDGKNPKKVSSRCTATVVREYENTQILCMYIELCGNRQSKYLSYILKNKDSNNLLFGSVAALAKTSDVSISTIKKVHSNLIKQGLLKKKQVAVHMVNPKLSPLCPNTTMLKLMNVWNDI